MKKILIMHNELCIGGAEKVLLNMLNEIDSTKYSVDLLLTIKSEWDDKVPKYINKRYIFKNDWYKKKKYQRIYRYGKMLIPRWILRKLVIKNKYDLAISYDMPMLWYLRACNCKKIMWTHTDYGVYKHFTEVKYLENKKILYNLINNRIIDELKKCDRIVCVAKTARDNFIKKTKLNDSKVTYKYNLNDTEQILKLSNEPVEEFSNLEGYSILTCVGRLVEQKAFHRIIILAEKLLLDDIKFKIFIIGEGPLRNDLENEIREKNLENHVILLGHNENPYKFISKSKLLICSSIYEAYCTVTKESIILNTPFVTTLCSGMEEQVGDSNAGIIVENTDESLYDAVKLVLEDEVLYEQMKLDIKKRANELSNKNILNEIERLFDEMLI